MSIEAMLAAARCISANAMQFRVSKVSVHEPCIFREEANKSIEARFMRGANGLLTGRLLTISSDGSEHMHLTAEIHSDPHDIGCSAQQHWAQGTALGAKISGASVYQVFFHGPSFQVIDTAQLFKGGMCCTLAANLPHSHRALNTGSELSPRLLELGLQTAGLLELAESGRMMIPHGVDAVVRCKAVDADSGQALRALARRRDGQLGISVDIVDEFNERVMYIENYRTVPLTLAPKPAGLQSLREQLRTRFSDAEPRRPM